MKQYYHSNGKFKWQKRYTVVAEVPDKAQLLHIQNPNHSKLLQIYTGVARVHPNDTHYVKAIGREVADSNLKSQTFRIHTVKFDDLGNMTIEMIKAFDDGEVNYLFFKVFQNRDKVYFLNAHINTKDEYANE